ncbi:Conserved hypothetical protein (containing Type II secretory pathway, prepilin signal peptidase PulO domain) [Pseudolactococcus piscium]|nr:Conserved hypothetical protein (containing Type II secretory pathway, prepilin signal peptidase PulO domain) [Lactococcus piscium]
MTLLLLFPSHFEWFQLDFSWVIICLASLPLVYFDIKYHAYPLLIWTIFFVILFLTVDFNLLILICLILAALTSILQLKIGSGDFLYLSLISFSISFFQLIFCLFIASSLALIYYLMFINKKEKEIPFLPFLFFAYLVTTYLCPTFW